MKFSIVILLVFTACTTILARPPSTPHIKGGIGDGYIYPAKPQPRSSTTYHAKPLHPHTMKHGPTKPKPQVYKVIIHDQPAKKPSSGPKKHVQVYKIVHLPHHGGGGGAAQHAASNKSVKIIKIIQFQQPGSGQNHNSGKWSK